MKKILYILPLLLAFASCDNFLDTESYTKKDTSNFPATLDDADKMLTGIYNTFSRGVSSAISTSFYVSELASDDRFGGGGENDRAMQSIDRLMNNGTSSFVTIWSARYAGIFRANNALETLDNCEGWANDEQKNHYKGEAHFLRAYFYFELIQLFGEVPLVLKTTAENLPKSSAEEVYAQIAYDLNQAITLMYNTPYSNVVAGHATKWAAEALIARVFLFYTGYYGKDSLPLPEGGNISKDQVITWLNDCISNSGHDLVGDFRNLWPYTNQYTAKSYQYAIDNNLKWEGNGNKETVFAIKFGTKVDFGQQYELGYSNQYCLHFGLRSPNGSAGTFPFGQGWGAGTVNSTLWKDWVSKEPSDIRRKASILDVTDASEISGYQWGADKQVEETGYWQKKYIGISAYDESGTQVPYAVLTDAAENNYQTAYTQDLVLIRFADVLLMHSELAQDATNLNRVRSRVNLPSVAYSLEAIKNERRWELSFEGLRYYDIMRWGDAAELLAKQEGVTIWNNNIETTMKRSGSGYKARFEATGGFWPIPESQIDLSDGVLTQNKGWGTPDAEYTGW